MYVLLILAASYSNNQLISAGKTNTIASVLYTQKGDENDNSPLTFANEETLEVSKNLERTISSPLSHQSPTTNARRFRTIPIKVKFYSVCFSKKLQEAGLSVLATPLRNLCATNSHKPSVNMMRDQQLTHFLRKK